MRWWQELEPEETRADFARIAAAGFDSVRVFLLWEHFQPEPHRVERAMLANLDAVADTAHDSGLLLVPTLFTGHMSGANWIPAWATTDGPRGRFPVVSGGIEVDRVARSWYEDDDIKAAQARLASEAATVLRGHPALWAWDLGNENSNACVPASRESGRAWLARMTDAIRAADPAALVTIGLHMEDLEEDRGIGPREAAEVCDFLSMHGYPLYAKWARTTVDPELPAFLTEITRWLGGKDVFFEEFGMPTPGPGDEAAMDAYVGEVLARLHLASATGAMLWCYGDYAPAIWELPPLLTAAHERTFGLWRADGTLKPAGGSVARFRTFAGLERRGATFDTPRWIDIPRESFYDAPLENLIRLYGRYLERQGAIGLLAEEALHALRGDGIAGGGVERP